MARLLFVIGKKNSGKTEVVKRLIPELNKLNFKVGVVKNDACGAFEWDTPNKDTYEFYESGAEMVGIISNEKFAVKYRRHSREQLDFHLITKHFYRDMDIILVEGFKSIGEIRIEVLRNNISNELLTEKKNLFATVGDRVFENLENHYTLEEICKLARYIKNNLNFLNSI